MKISSRKFALLAFLALASCVSRNPVDRSAATDEGAAEPVASSTYDVALRELGEAATMLEVERVRKEAERQKLRRETAVFTADIEAALKQLVADANREAELDDGKVYVSTEAFERAVYFVPGETGLVPDAPADWHAGVWGIVNEEPILKDSPASSSWERKPGEQMDFLTECWTDTFAIAVEQSYHYEKARLVEIKRNYQEPFLTVRVACEVRVSHRWYVAGSPAGLPEAPAGYAYWAPASDQWEIGRNLRGARGRRLDRSGAKRIVKSLPLPKMAAPKGTLFRGEAEPDSLTLVAIGGLASEAFSEVTILKNFYLEYSPEHSGWVFNGAGSGPASPTLNLSWDYGTEGFNPIFVGRPSPE